MLPGGTKLPSRSKLCQEFNTSEKTVRRAIQMLAEEGMVETVQRKRPTIAMNFRTQDSQSTIQRARSAAANDLLQTGILLCYPVNRRGMFLCKGEEWNTPETIVENMDPHSPTEFWRLSNRLWRYFICRNENEFIVRVVDSLGFSELEPISGTLEMRKKYQAGLKELIRIMKQGGMLETVHFDDLYVLYGLEPEEEKGETADQIRPVSLPEEQIKDLEYRLCKDQERYSGVYLDILGLIAVGRYNLQSIHEGSGSAV